MVRGSSDMKFDSPFGKPSRFSSCKRVCAERVRPAWLEDLNMMEER